ncbi:MAG: hypothetical protein R3C28_21200 [Pirellulaceae bacterium]
MKKKSASKTTTKAAKSSGSTKKKVTKKTKKKPTPNDPVTVDLRRKDRRSSAPDTATAAPVKEVRKVQRRRQIDPTTCERDYSLDEIEFMHALDDYKRANGRMFPTCSEILEVVRSIGYIKLTEEQQATLNGPAPGSETTAADEETATVDNGAKLPELEITSAGFGDSLNGSLEIH